MKQYLDELPQELKEIIKAARSVSRRQGVKVYLVGGFVRDLIMGVENFDLDFAVEGDGIRFAESLAEEFKAGLTRHHRFGTATVVSDNNIKIDIATTRSETYPHPGALPVVTPSSLIHDLKRRDFTINAMAIDITREQFGRCIDLYGGRKDIKEKKIRVLHEKSFFDDPTRMLRAIRFEQRYHFALFSETLGLLKEAVRSKALEQVQPQRIRDELILMLSEKEIALQLTRMKELTGFAFLSGKLRVSQEIIGLMRDIRRETARVKQRHPRHQGLDEWLIYFMGLVGSLPPGEIETICKRFVFRKQDEKRIATFRQIESKFAKQLSREDLAPSRIYDILEPVSGEALVLLMARYKKPALRKNVESFLDSYSGVRIRITGEDLKRIGMQPGPQYQHVLLKVLHARLDGAVATKEEELSLARKLAKNK